MGRVRGSGKLGTVRSLRLPLDLDRWFEERLVELRDRSSSQLLLELIHGGLRLRPGYMSVHKQRLQAFTSSTDRDAYVQALSDSFGEEYVAHVIAWASAERAGKGRNL